MVAFTDESIRRLRHSPTPQRFRDPQLARHFLVVGPHSKTFFVQVERPKDHGARKTFKVQTGACPEDTIAEARERAATILRRVSSGENVSAEATRKARPAARTLAECWAEFERHHKTLVEAGDRSPGTLRLYRVVYGKHLAPLGGEVMRGLADDPERIRQLHDDIASVGIRGRTSGPCVASSRPFVCWPASTGWGETGSSPCARRPPLLQRGIYRRNSG